MKYAVGLRHPIGAIQTCGSFYTNLRNTYENTKANAN